ncbi:hypothetical protein FRC0522_00474 [Corynebacterium diphtheriae]|nr:hypothetical protein FRC0522_00474 [Corynebacterium diphtheriae]
MSNLDKAADLIAQYEAEPGEFNPRGLAQQLADRGLLVDDYHNIDELYDYRCAYNALIFNEWERQGIYAVHKSIRHSDGNLCFGGGWFIVSANTPTGQITNHYPMRKWDMFKIPEFPKAATWDGHTPQIALQRLENLLR